MQKLITKIGKSVCRSYGVKLEWSNQYIQKHVTDMYIEF